MTEATTAAEGTTATAANDAAATAAADGSNGNTAATSSDTTTASAQAGDGAAASSAADWRASITDPEALEFAKRTQSVADLAKVAMDLRKANSTMIRVPGKDAKPEDLAKFHKAIGVPEKPEDYKFDLGREPTEQDKTTTGEIAKAFHKHGVPLEAASAVSKAVVDIANAQLAEADRVAQAKREEAIAGLRKELGSEFEKHVSVAVRAVEVFGGDAAKAWLNETMVDGAKLGDHPMFIRLFGKIGLRMGEGEFIGAVTQTERQSMQDELNRLMLENPPGTDKYKQPAVQKRLSELHSALYGNAPVVGAQGRAV